MTEREKFMQYILSKTNAEGDYLYDPAKLRTTFEDGEWKFACIQIDVMWQGWQSAYQQRKLVDQ